MADSFEPSRDHVTTPQAERLSGLTKNYLAKLLRQGILEGFQFGREWIIYMDSLEKFLATDRKTGPKGPHSKPSESPHP